MFCEFDIYCVSFSDFVSFVYTVDIEVGELDFNFGAVNWMMFWGFFMVQFLERGTEEACLVVLSSEYLN